MENEERNATEEGCKAAMILPGIMQSLWEDIVEEEEEEERMRKGMEREEKEVKEEKSGDADKEIGVRGRTRRATRERGRIMVFFFAFLSWREERDFLIALFPSLPPPSSSSVAHRAAVLGLPSHPIPSLPKPPSLSTRFILVTFEN